MPLLFRLCYFSLKPSLLISLLVAISVTRLAIYWTLGKFSKPLATIKLAKSPTFLGNFCKSVEICHFSSEIIFGQLLETFGDFFSGHTGCDRQFQFQMQSFYWRPKRGTKPLWLVAVWPFGHIKYLALNLQH